MTNLLDEYLKNEKTSSKKITKIFTKNLKDLPEQVPFKGTFFKLSWHKQKISVDANFSKIDIVNGENWQVEFIGQYFWEQVNIEIFPFPEFFPLLAIQPDVSFLLFEFPSWDVIKALEPPPPNDLCPPSPP